MKRNIGFMGLIMGSLSLALEIYAFKFLQALEMANGKWYTNAWMYATEPQCAIALLVTVVVILVSLWGILATDKKNSNKK